MRSLYESIFDDAESIEDKMSVKSIRDVKNELDFEYWLVYNHIELTESDVKKIYKELDLDVVDKDPKLQKREILKATQYTYGFTVHYIWGDDYVLGLKCSFDKNGGVEVNIAKKEHGVETKDGDSELSLMLSPTYEKWINKVEKQIKKEGLKRYTFMHDEVSYR